MSQIISFALKEEKKNEGSYAHAHLFDLDQHIVKDVGNDHVDVKHVDIFIKASVPFKAYLCRPEGFRLSTPVWMGSSIETNTGLMGQSESCWKGNECHLSDMSGSGHVRVSLAHGLKLIIAFAKTSDTLESLIQVTAKCNPGWEGISIGKGKEKQIVGTEGSGNEGYKWSVKSAGSYKAASKATKAVKKVGKGSKKPLKKTKLTLKGGSGKLSKKVKHAISKKKVAKKGTKLTPSQMREKLESYRQAEEMRKQQAEEELSKRREAAKEEELAKRLAAMIKQ